MVIVVSSDELQQSSDDCAIMQSSDYIKVKEFIIPYDLEGTYKVTWTMGLDQNTFNCPGIQYGMYPQIRKNGTEILLDGNTYQWYGAGYREIVLNTPLQAGDTLELWGRGWTIYSYWFGASDYRLYYTESLPDIVATEISPSTTYCIEPCNLTVDITWTNNGTGPGTFEPAILLDTNRTGTGESITLNPLETITRTFTISNLTKGLHEICTDPNSLPCITVDVVSPAQIIATSIVPDTVSCLEPCNINVDITWRNDGDVSGSFTPTILVNGTPTSMTSETLDPGQSSTKTFTIYNLMKGSYEICADPNTLPCVTITVEKVATAGIGNVLMLGLLSGGLLLFFAKEKEKKEKEKL